MNSTKKGQKICSDEISAGFSTLLELKREATVKVSFFLKKKGEY